MTISNIIKLECFICKVVLFASIFMINSMAGQAKAAGFNCETAQSPVEIRICENRELSSLDDKLNDIYRQAQSKVTDLLLLKHQQSLWLRTRIHDIAKWQSIEWARGGYETDLEFCEQFMNDFIVGNKYTAIEPIFTAKDEHDERFYKYNKCGDTTFAQKPDEYNFYYLSMLGGPPYRYYLLELDGDRSNGLVEVIYTTFTHKEGTTGYAWIKAEEESCSVYGGATSGAKDWMGIPRTYYRLNTLIKYKDDYYAVFLEPAVYEGRGRSFAPWPSGCETGHPSLPFAFGHAAANSFCPDTSRVRFALLGDSTAPEGLSGASRHRASRYPCLVDSFNISNLLPPPNKVRLLRRICG